MKPFFVFFTMGRDGHDGGREGGGRPPVSVLVAGCSSLTPVFGAAVPQGIHRATPVPQGAGGLGWQQKHERVGAALHMTGMPVRRGPANRVVQ